MIKARLVSHVGAPRTVSEHTVKNTKELLALVEATYAPLGFSKFKIADDGYADLDGGRVTGTTPGGRGGRNLAFYDFDYGEES